MKSVPALSQAQPTQLFVRTKEWLRRVLPAGAWRALKFGRDLGRATYGWINGKVFEFALVRLETDRVVRILQTHDLNVSRVSDFYSPLPVASVLEKNLSRWFRPTELIGVQYDLEEMKTWLQQMVAAFGHEYRALPSYDLNDSTGYGPGFTKLDAMLLYFIIRSLKPKRYIEIGSGLSTYYTWLAATRNANEGAPLRITCVDPYPFERIHSLTGVEILKMEVQDAELSLFNELGTGDVLFIDSTHVVKIDGDIPFLYLEVIPRLQKGVLIQVHDVHFPYNVPYPPEYYLFGDSPLFRTEAMIVQAFLSYNDAFRIRMSLPMLRFFHGGSLQTTIPDYEPLRPEDSRTHFGSLWLERIK